MVATMNNNGVHSKDVIQAWGRILAGYRPNLSIEITKECPLRCPGCYAYGDDHLGGDVTLRGLSDYKGDELVERFMALVDRHRPLHISIVGGEPLVRYRELGVILPRLAERGIHTQLVTSAVRPIPIEWASVRRLQVVVSIDGLPPEHDERRTPATYDRILKHIAGHQITVHCTVTRQQARRDGYLEEFLRLWQANRDTRLIWVSLYTPQRGEISAERLSAADRARVIGELRRLRGEIPKLQMLDGMLNVYSRPPESPDDCIFAQTTACFSSDLERRITPCQFGGNPDCSNCGCIASAGLEAIGRHRLRGGIPVGRIFYASLRVGKAVAGLRSA
jgi:MoaA/NifB/PqqE/SkfB family radical SAM enzyme